MGKASQRKGAQGERELAEILHDALGVDTRRGTILYGGSADVEGLPLVHVECIRGLKSSLFTRRLSSLQGMLQKLVRFQQSFTGEIINRGLWLCPCLIGWTSTEHTQRGGGTIAKICPLLMIARGDVLGAGLCNCIEEMCAWYVTHGCAIVSSKEPTESERKS